MDAVDDPQEEPPAGLFRRWVHAHEEDYDDVSVYRPTGYAFPPARGRSGVEFRTDGTFVDHPIGRGDAPASVPGFWHAEDGLRITLSFPGTGRPDRVVELVACDAEVLRLRQPG